MKKYLLLTMACFMRTAYAAALILDPDTILTQSIQLIEFADEENQARAKILEDCDKETQKKIIFLAELRFFTISAEIKELKGIYGNWVSDEILALQKERSELPVRPEMRFMARGSYVVDKQSYESERLSFGDRKAKYCHLYRYLVDLIQLRADHDQINDSPMRRSGCGPFFAILPQLIEEAKKVFLESTSLYKDLNSKEFFEIHEQLSSQLHEKSALKELEEVIADLLFFPIQLKIKELHELTPEVTDEILALCKKCAELPLNRAKKFVAKAGCFLAKQGYDSKRLTPGDLKAKFLYEHRALKKISKILVELIQVKDDPEIIENYAELVELLPQILDAIATDFAETTMRYMFENPKEFFETKNSLSSLVPSDE